MQRHVAEAYTEQCTRKGGGREGGVRGGLVGVEIGNSNETSENVSKLVFSRPSSGGGRGRTVATSTSRA